jgi:hypothetical protein
MDHLGVKPGQKVAVVRTPEGIALSAAKFRFISAAPIVTYISNLY